MSLKRFMCSGKRHILAPSSRQHAYCLDGVSNNRYGTGVVVLEKHLTPCATSASARLGSTLKAPIQQAEISIRVTSVRIRRPLRKNWIIFPTDCINSKGGKKFSDLDLQLAVQIKGNKCNNASKQTCQQQQQEAEDLF
jgi:hypothetical protein